MIALHVVCLTLVTASVAMRFYTRYFITKSKCGLDDGSYQTPLRPLTTCAPLLIQDIF
jgi:hypothetical protein